MGLVTAIAIGAGISAVGTAISTGVSMYSADQQGRQQAALNEYNAKIARNQAIANQQIQEYNAQLMEREADAADATARVKEQQQRKENERFQARQRAAYAKSGALMEGTPLAVLGESAANLELNALEVKRQGLIERDRYLNQANMYRYQGESLFNAGMSESGLYSSQADIAKANANTAKYGSLLNGVSSILSTTGGMIAGAGASKTKLDDSWGKNGTFSMMDSRVSGM